MQIACTLCSAQSNALTHRTTCLGDSACRCGDGHCSCIAVSHLRDMPLSSSGSSTARHLLSVSNAAIPTRGLGDEPYLSNPASPTVCDPHDLCPGKALLLGVSAFSQLYVCHTPLVLAGGIRELGDLYRARSSAETINYLPLYGTKIVFVGTPVVFAPCSSGQ